MGGGGRTDMIQGHWVCDDMH